MQLFDRTLLRRRRDRAAPGFSAHDFLIRHASEDMAERLMAVNRNFPLALDLGAHQGALSHAPLPEDKIGVIVETDLSSAMLAGPAQKVRQKTQPLRLAADEEALPFAEESADLVTSLLSLHLVNDLPGTLIQIRRILKPDGLFIGALFGGETLSELREAMSLAEIECEGGLSPRIAPFTEIRDLGGLMQRAGFALPVTDADKLTVRYATPMHLLNELRGMGETNMLSERRKTPLRRATLMRMMEIYQEKFSDPDGRIRATFEIHYVTGWAPHESQQKPLRPGSAKTRLADALGVSERPAGEKPGPKQE
ncbi:methyltransferase domain-containing protein [Tepidicaulis sp.]|uniref:methyltransferase domain-containing protein n=1 Tax=Tepidicaulis sp. TaxID=1920809 RepID=UPI003B5AE87F